MSTEKLEVGMKVKVSGPYEGKDLNGNEKFGFDEITRMTMTIEKTCKAPTRLTEFLLSSPSMSEGYWVLGTIRFTKV